MSGWRKRQILEIQKNLQNEKSFWKKTFEMYGKGDSLFRKKIAELMGLDLPKNEKEVCQQNTEKLK